jgi:predicted negative regulator of RcsB-dependent stress response
MAEEYLTDDEQLEAIKRGIAENGVWIVAGIVIGVALLFGWRHYQSHQNQVAFEAAAQFGAMTASVGLNDKPKARQIADGIIKNYPKSPYADQAQLTLARLSVDDGQLSSAVAPLTQVMNTSKDTELRHIARLRLARVLIDEGKADEAIATLAEDKWGAFSSRAHEIRGDAFYAKKDLKGALTEYQAALNGGDSSNVDTALLELKLADLGAPPMPATAMIPLPTIQNKAKP